MAYGESPFSFAPKHDMTISQSEKLFEDFFRNKPKIKDFIDKTHEQVKQQGFVTTMQGYRRNLRDVYSQDKRKQGEALRQSVNTIIQGSGAYLTNCSVIEIEKFIERHNLRSRVIMTVHDSIVIDSPKEEIHIMAKAAVYIMENLPLDWLFIEWEGKTLRYPIKADCEIGVNYNDMVDYDREEIESFNSIAGYCKYYLDLKKVKNYKEVDLIDDTKYDMLVNNIENRKPEYQSVS